MKWIMVVHEICVHQGELVSMQEIMVVVFVMQNLQRSGNPGHPKRTHKPPLKYCTTH